MTEKPKSMPGKVGGLLGSIRFWQLTLAAAAKVAATAGLITEDIANVIVAWFGSIVLVGTADKIAKVAAGKPSH